MKMPNMTGEDWFAAKAAFAATPEGAAAKATHLAVRARASVALEEVFRLAVLQSWEAHRAASTAYEVLANEELAAHSVWDAAVRNFHFFGKK